MVMTIKRKLPKKSARKSPAACSGVVTPDCPRRQGAEPGHGRARVASPARIDPLAMTVAQAAKVLSAVGVGAVTEKLIRRHIASGAPATSAPDRRGVRINLVQYAAWLNLPADHAGQKMGKGSEGVGGHGA